MNRLEDGNKFNQAQGGYKPLNPNHVPIAFQHVSSYPERRHKEWQEMLVRMKSVRPPQNLTSEYFLLYPQ
jgi:hypothetical protein